MVSLGDRGVGWNADGWNRDSGLRIPAKYGNRDVKDVYNDGRGEVRAEDGMSIS
jgi:hypothetical protein